MLSFDHLVFLSANPEHDARAVAAQGFTVEPPGRHPELGTHNRLIMLQSTYLEMLGVERPTPHTAFYEACLRDGTGHVGIALRGNARGAYDDFRARGIQADPPLAFSRPVEIEGRTEQARFEIVRVAISETPGAFLFVCEHHTPHLVWRSPPAHANGARDITRLAWSSQHPAAMAAAFARVLGLPATGTPEAPRLVFPNAEFEFCGPPPGGDRLAEFVLAGPATARHQWPGAAVQWRSASPG